MSRAALVVGLCAVVLVVAPLVGPIPSPEVAPFVLTQLRIPRVLVGAEVGACLGIVGAAFQAIFRNPLATPSTTGTTAGAALGALAALVLLPVAWTHATLVVAGFAFAGAVAVAWPVAVLAASGRARIEDVLLAGIATTLAAGALTTGLQVQADQAATLRAVRWSLGSLSQVGYGGAGLLLPFVVLSVAVTLGRTRSLQAMVGGEARVWSHRVCRPDRAPPGPAVAGRDPEGTAADVGHRGLPVGVLTAALGAPLLVFLVLRRAR